MKMKNLKKLSLASLGIVSTLVTGSVFAATATDLTGLATAVDYTDLKAAIFTLFGAMIAVGLILKGGNLVLQKSGWK